MNTNLLNIVKRIATEQGEGIMGDPQRLKTIFRNLAGNEPKPLRTAFGRCIEAGAYAALKPEPDAAKRAARKAALARRLRNTQGLNKKLCAEALDILEAALYGTASAARQPPGYASARKRGKRGAVIALAAMAAALAAATLIFFPRLRGIKTDTVILQPDSDIVEPESKNVEVAVVETKTENVPAATSQSRNGAESPKPPSAPAKPAPAVEKNPLSMQEQIYASYLNTPPEKYIPGMKKRIQEIQTNGVEWQTIRVEYHDAAPRFIIHQKLLPGWKNSEGLNEYDFVCLRWTNSDFSYMGSYAKYRTIEFRDTLAFESKKRLQSDSAYRDVVEAAKRICDEIDYNWAAYSGYKGAPPVPSRGKRLEVCEGYTNESMRRLSALDCVAEIQKWSVPGVHTWNILKLKDGRTLYCDVTWFDNDHIDAKTGQITYADDYDWENITFDEDLFLHGQVSYGTRDFTHASNRRVLEDSIRLY
jgi:hypothetical protein